ARGIDVDDISHVVNFELPNVPETYVHRIGRTGRAGKGGTAISLCDAEERSYLLGIERLTGKRVNVIAEHPFLPVPGRAVSADPSPAERGHDGRRRPRSAAGGGGRNADARGPSRFGARGGGARPA